MKSDLEKAIDDKIKPKINLSIKSIEKIDVDKLNQDITEKIKRFQLHASINTLKPFKLAKKDFKKEFLRNLIKKNCGNISEVARIADIDRRSIHRIVDESDIKTIREQLPRRYELRQNELNDLFENVTDSYKAVVPEQIIKEIYKDIPKITEEIIEEIPDGTMSLKDAEEEFEKEYIEKALQDNDYNIGKTAKLIGIRHETLSRKVKALGLV